MKMQKAKCKMQKVGFGKIVLRGFLLLLFLSVITGCINKSDKTVIQFSSWGSQSEIAILKPILAEFEKENPDIKVDFIHIPQNYFQKLHLLFASNLAPDVVFINNLYLPIYANAGVLIDLGNREQETGNRNIFYAKALKALSYNGKLYAIPRDVSNLVIYYNKDLFDKYNIQYPNKYWTFNDFLAIAKKLTKDTNNDGKPDVWGVSFEEDLYYYLPYLMSEGGGALSDDLNENIFSSPQSQKGLKFYADLRNKYKVAPKKSDSASETMAQMFLQQKIVMHLCGRWMVPKYRTDAKFDWDVINFPSGDKGSIVALDASGWAVTKSSKHKNEAYKLIKYLSSKESIEKFTKSGLIVPARIDVSKDFAKETFKPKSNNIFIDVIKTSKPTPVSVNYSEIQDEIKEKTQYLFN